MILGTGCRFGVPNFTNPIIAPGKDASNSGFANAGVLVGKVSHALQYAVNGRPRGEARALTGHF